ncbi:MAG: TIGR00730 family Rossman fold protein [Gemmatimonadota bacterium]|nr:TIGR00730 family Rossman fold protein [Gemmatimonadota bacterium]
MTLHTVCVFCAAGDGRDPVYVKQALEMGRYLAESGRRIVYGGGRTGLMGALAEGALAAGGEIIGIMPKHLVDHEVAHTGLTELRVVASMHERKAMLAELSDGFLAMPGGLGTLEELFEIWTWGQLGLHRKPYGVLNVNGYFSPLLQFLDHAVTEQFVRPEYRALLVVDTEPAALIAQMESMEPPPLPRWVQRETT